MGNRAGLASARVEERRKQVTPERWQEMKKVLAGALERAPTERRSYLDRACADASLRREVESLIAANEQGNASFMKQPAIETGTLKTGSKLGPYEILSSLGAGGMGEVYRARDTRLDRMVAIKVLLDHQTSEPGLRERFEREARAISSLNHSHVCTLYDVGHQDGVDYLVMEYIEGETLAARLVKGPLPLDQVLKYAIEIADALGKAHRQGITHRDLKPGNIMLTKSGAKLLDFGLAKLRQQASPAVPISQVSTAAGAITAPGMILGTLRYMAPEQVEGKAADARADIFALGAVIYEMATGKKAFEGKSQASLIAAILEREPAPISSLQPMTPPALDRVVKTCLAKDPEDRWQNAQDLKRELGWIADGVSETSAPASRSARRNMAGPVGWIVATIVVVVAVTLVVVSLLNKPSPAPRLQVSLPPPDNTSYSTNSRFAISPDAKKIAFVADNSPTSQSLWIRSLDSTAAQSLAGTEGASNPFWSPDGKSVGFFADEELKTIGSDGGPVTTLAKALGIGGGTWGPDGTIVFQWGVEGGGLLSVSANGGPVSELTRVDANRKESAHRWPFFLPDGRHLLFQVKLTNPSQDGSVNQIHVLDLLTRKQTVLLRSDSNAEYANGYLLRVQQGSLMAQPFDISTLTLSGVPISLAEQVDVARVGVADFSTSQSGSLTFEKFDNTTKLVMYSREGKEIGQVGSPKQFGEVSLSPDGTRVATTFSDPYGRSRAIWVFELARGTSSRVTAEGIGADYPIWNSGGSELTYFVPAGGGGIYLRSPDELGSSSVLVESVAMAQPDSISPDGKLLAYASFVAGKGPRIWIHDFAPEKSGTKDYPLLGTDSNEFQAQFSADGRWLAYNSNETGREEIYVVPFPGSSHSVQISTSGGSQPRWRRDGREIYYIAPDAKMMAAAIQFTGQSLQAATPKVLFQTRIDSIGRSPHEYDVTADGRKFLINSRPEQAPQPITLYVNWTAALKK
jgi:serine/threonine protein kinase